MGETLALPEPLASSFRPVSRSDRGGVSELYRAVDESGRAVAIKVLRAELCGEPILRRRMEREARLGSELRNEHLARVESHGATPDGAPYIVFEWVDGEALSEMLSREAPLPTGRVVSIAAAVLDALSALHGRGVVHRDVKPDNVVVGERVVLMDLGIAAEVAGDDLTPAGRSMGTPRWTAPEVVAGAPGRDPRADVWSVGVTMYEMTTGEAPFRGDDDATLLRAIADDAPAPLRAFVADVPALLDDVVVRALAKDPAARFADAADMLVALRAAPKNGAIVP